MWRELEPAMGPSRRRQGVRGLCACARPAALCAKRARCFGEEGCPRARGARSRGWGGETTHRNAELQDGLQAPACHRAALMGRQQHGTLQKSLISRVLMKNSTYLHEEPVVTLRKKLQLCYYYY